ncbi:hypothetical protein ACOMHN_063246 [Nucella lapillus]
MEGGAIAGIVIGVVVFIAILLVVAFFIFKRHVQGRCKRRNRKGKDYSSGQSQIRRKDGTIEAVRVKRQTKNFHTNSAGDMPASVTKVNRPDDNGVFIVPIPPPPEQVRT